MQFAITTQDAAYGPYNSERSAEQAAKWAGLVDYRVVRYWISPPKA